MSRSQGPRDVKMLIVRKVTNHYVFWKEVEQNPEPRYKCQCEDRNLRVKDIPYNAPPATRRCCSTWFLENLYRRGEVGGFRHANMITVAQDSLYSDE